MTGWLDSPIFWASVVAGLVAVATWFGDKYIAKRAGQNQEKYSDRELLSKDEKAFLATIMEQLHQCEEEGRQKDVLILELQRASIKADGRISRLEYELEQFKEKVTVAAQAGAAAVAAVQQGAVDILKQVVEPLEKPVAKPLEKKP